MIAYPLSDTQREHPDPVKSNATQIILITHKSETVREPFHRRSVYFLSFALSVSYLNFKKKSFGTHGTDVV